jgi:hypothetical protein
VAVRREQVILELVDDFTSKAARAAVAADVLAHSVDNMGGHARSVGGDMQEAERGTNAFAKTAGNSTTQIDRYSGRLGLLAEAAVALGPALIPLGASTIPVLTGALAGLGSAAGGIGVAILAFKGLGDGIKALDTYSLAPTIQNLDKLRAAEEKLGPAGTQFLKYLHDIEPQLRGLQDVARAGLLPGVEQGLTDLLQRLPMVRGIVKSLSTEMGTLAAEAGHSLSSSEWRPFFQYVRHEAAPTLDAFAHSAGNVVLGLANLLVAFAPLSQSFGGGLEQMTQAFADWSKHLDTNQSFQNFLAYVQRSGPEAIAFFGALAHAIIGITKAAQPWGNLVLPVLTEALNLFSAIANSDAGPALYATAAAMLVFGRAAKVAGVEGALFASSSSKITLWSTRAGAGLALLALSATDVDNKLGLSNTAMDAMAGLLIGGPVGLALGAGVGLFQDIAKANGSWNAALQGTETALQSHSLTQLQMDLKSVNAQLAQVADAHKNVNDLGWGIFAPSHIGNQVKATIGEITGKVASLTERQGELKTSMQEGGSIADLFGHDIGRTGAQMQVAANEAGALSRALAQLNGFFSKRDAVFAYKDAVDALTKGLKDGFTRADAEQLDQVGQSILQVANQIKNPDNRATFLQGARSELESIAKNAGPQARRAIQGVVAAFDDRGLTHPKTITPQVDPKPAQKSIDKVKHQFDIMTAMSGGPTVKVEGDTANLVINGIETHLRRVSAEHANPKVQVDPGNSIGLMGIIEHQLAAIDGRVATATVRTVHVGGLGPQAAGSADGSTVPKGGTYADRYLYLLAPGEEVISNRYGQADRHRDLLKAINAGRMAGGGTAGGHSGNVGSIPGPGNNQLFLAFVNGVDTATSSLKSLHIAADAEAKALDKAKTRLGNIRSAEGSLTSTVSSSFGLDSVFNLSAASGNPWAGGASGGSFNPTANLNAITSQANQFIADVKTLQSNGVKGAALQAILSQGPTVVHAMAQMSPADLSAEVSAFTAASAAVAQASSLAGTAIYGQQETAAVKELKGIRKDLHVLNQAVKAGDKANQKGHKSTAQAAANSGTKAAAHARRRAKAGG